MSDSNPEARDRVSDMLAKWCGEQAPTDADYMCEAGSPGHKPGIPAATPDPPPDDLCAVVFRALHSSRNTQMSDEMRAAYIASVITAEAAPAASPDERLREAVAALPQYVITIQDREGYTYERGCEGQPMNYTGVMLADVEALVGKLKDGATTARETTNELKDAAADREAPDGETPAASPDERLREALERANDDLILIADESPEGVGESIDSVRAAIKDALAAADREKPEE